MENHCPYLQWVILMGKMNEIHSCISEQWLRTQKVYDRLIDRLTTADFSASASGILGHALQGAYKSDAGTGTGETTVPLY